MSSRIAASLTMVLTLSGSTLLSQTVLPQVVKNVDPRVVENTLRRKLIARLHDPFSAKLRNVRLFHAVSVDHNLDGQRQLLWDDYALCGEIISKNLFGAYTGYRRFFSSVSVHKLLGPVTYTSWQLDIEGGESTVKPFPDRYRDTCRNGYFDLQEDWARDAEFTDRFEDPPSSAATPELAVPIATSVAPSEELPPPSFTAPVVPMAVGGAIRQPTKIKDVRPSYPPIAQSARVQGVVILQATIGADGKVADAKVIRSIPLLDAAALDAVRQWEYTATLFNGVAVPVIMTVSVSFTLTR